MKRNFWNRILSLALCCVMVCGILPVQTLYAAVGTGNEKAHLVIDYNPPGVLSSEGVQVDSEILDLGEYDVGDTVEFALASNFGGIVSVLKPNMGTAVYANGTTEGGSIGSIVIEFDGLWTTEDESGERISDSLYQTVEDGNGVWCYTLDSEGLTTLYVHWTVNKFSSSDEDVDVQSVSDEIMTMNEPSTNDVNEDNIDLDKLINKSKLYSVIFDDNYYGGGKTTVLFGRFTLPIAMKAAIYRDIPRYNSEGKYIECDHYWDWTSNGTAGGSGDFFDTSLNSQWDISHTYDVSVQFTQAPNPLRTGWRFVGWGIDSGSINTAEYQKYQGADVTIDALGDYINGKDTYKASHFWDNRFRFFGDVIWYGFGNRGYISSNKNYDVEHNLRLATASLRENNDNSLSSVNGKGLFIYNGDYENYEGGVLPDKKGSTPDPNGIKGINPNVLTYLLELNKNIITNESGENEDITTNKWCFRAVWMAGPIAWIASDVEHAYSSFDGCTAPIDENYTNQNNYQNPVYEEKGGYGYFEESFKTDGGYHNLNGWFGLDIQVNDEGNQYIAGITDREMNKIKYVRARANPSTVYRWPGAVINTDYVDIVGGNGGVPVRTGYEFDTWYYQASCSIPIDENETGVQPTRDYYAGWIPQPVYVNYYDTREGTSLITTQEYTYDDVLYLLDTVNDTAGEHFVSWNVGKKDGPDITTCFDKDKNVEGIIQLNEFLNDDIPNYPKFDYTFSSKLGLQRHETMKNENQVDYQYYWTLDLYANYDHQTANYTVNLRWDDDSNNDGVRPQSVKVGLIDSRGNAIIDEKTMSGKGDVWTTTFSGLDITTSDVSTEKVTYSFCLLDYKDANSNKIYNIADTGSTSGEIKVSTKSGAGSTDAMSTYTYGLNRYSSTNSNGGTEISSGKSLYNSYTGDIYMSHDLILTGDDIKFTIQWKDDGNRDGKRPQALTLQLIDAKGNLVYPDYADSEIKNLTGNSGEQSVSAAMCDVSPDGNTWTYTFKDYQKYTNGGNLAGYRVVISDDSGLDALGYSIKYVGTDTNSKVGGDDGVILEYHPEQRKIEGKIRWDDGNNRDGQRPTHVDVTLWAYQWNDKTYQWERKTVKTQTVEASSSNTLTDSEWAFTFGDQLTYCGGQEIIYRMEVSSDLNAHLSGSPGEYSWSESTIGPTLTSDSDGTESQEISVRVYDKRSLMSVPVTVEWKDSGNNDNIRPSSVVLQLYYREAQKGKDGNIEWSDLKPVDNKLVSNPQDYRVIVSGDKVEDLWNYTFENLPRYANGGSGNEVPYAVMVEEVIKPGGNSNDGKIYGSYVITSNGEEEVITRYTDYYIDKDGKLNHELNSSTRPYVLLEHIATTQTVDFFVNWHDDDNRDGVRPDSIQVDLWKTVGDNTPVYQQTLILDYGENGTWSKTVSKLAGYENGQKVRYTIEVPDDVKDQLAKVGYTTTTQDNIVHMYYTPSVGTVSTELYWTDLENKDGYRPDGVMAELYANGVATGKVAELNKANGWKASWSDLPVNYVTKEGRTANVVYSVRIDAPDGYSLSYNPESVTIPDGQVIYINLVHGEDLKPYTAYIHWNDGNDRDGVRPETVRIALLADGKLCGRSADLTASDAVDVNTWTYRFDDLPVHDGSGHAINYSVVVQDDSTWKTSYESMTAENHLYFYHGVATSNMYVSFQFDDNNNANGDRPTALYLSLKADGRKVDDSRYKHTVSFDANVDGWSWTFSGLPVFSADGVKISYSVDVAFDDRFGATDYRVQATDDIELNVGADETVNQVIVKLAKDRKTADQVGYIYWYDMDNLFGDRPESVTVLVNNTYSGARTTYTVDMTTGEVTNRTTHVLAGHVKELERQSPKYTKWEYVIEDLPFSYWNDKDGGSTPIYYYTTTTLSGSDARYIVTLDGENSGMDTVLKHELYEDYADKAAQDYVVNLLWDDNGDLWGYRPDTNGVKVEIVRKTNDGEKAEGTYVFTKENALVTNPNAWKHQFRNLPTFADGGPVVYFVRVTGPDGYVQESLMETDTESTVRMSQVVGFDLSVNWDDSSNDDAKRPESVSVDVFADGVLADTVTLTGTNNRWTGSVSGLRVWRQSDTDAPVQYSFRWNGATQDHLTKNSYTARATKDGTDVTADAFYWLSVDTFGDNTLEGYDALANSYDWETTLGYNREHADYSFSIRFDDNADQDGIRPAGPIVVDLLADGTVVDTTEVAVNAEDTEYGLMFRQKPVNEAGSPIVYTIKVHDEGSYDGYEVVYDESHTAATLRHVPETTSVTMTLTWLDDSWVHDVINPLNGQLAYTYNQILRKDANLQLYGDGKALDRVFVPKTYYGESPNLLASKTVTIEGLPVYRDHGTKVVYTMDIVDSADIEDLKTNGYEVAHTDTGEYDLSMSVSHDYFDVSGKVYYMYTRNDDFLLRDTPVTIYRYGEDGKYHAAGTGTTDANGRFVFRNLPNGLYIVRATHVYNGNTLAGTVGTQVNRKNVSVTVVVDRDAANDAANYLYSAKGRAFYQTNANDASTRTPVPEGSVVLLFQVKDGTREPEYAGMTSTNADGWYSFGNLPSMDYLVNVVFNYAGGSYTYDNGDAVSDGLSFRITGADVAWPDIVKQVNLDVSPEDPDVQPVVPDEPEVPEVTNCVLSGKVFYDDNGVHTTDPVQGVDVYLYVTGSNQEVGRATTGADGVWTMKAVPAGSYTAVFSYKANASRVLLFNVTDDEYEAGSRTVDTQYFGREANVPTGTIRGVVLDEDGSTMKALVAIYDLDHRDADGNPVLADFAYTDTYGLYEFTVVAGYDYRVKILAVENRETVTKAGKPGDGLTTLDHFELSGHWGLNGVDEAGRLIAVYEEVGGEFKLVTATLTDANGNYVAEVERAGNYMVCPYVNDKVYDKFYLSVGLEGTIPVSTKAVNGSWTISGGDSYDAVRIYRTSDSLDRLVYENGAGSGYVATNLDAGTYRIELEKDGRTVTYYTAAPADLQVSMSYKVAIKGEVKQDGRPVGGATVFLRDAEGRTVGSSFLTTVSNAKYGWTGLPAGDYEVVITAPNSTSELANKTTAERDTYSNSYPDGMAEDGEWVWNVNAIRVTGYVRDQKGEPIADAMVTFKVMGGDRQYASMTREDGSYDMGVAPGKYAVNCVYDWDASHRFNGESLGYKDVQSDMYDCNFVIRRDTMTLKTVRTVDDKPVHGARVKVFFIDGTLYWEGEADDKGEVEVVLYEGAYKAEAVYDGTKGINGRFVSEDGGTAVISIDSVSYITGRVTGVDGRPVTDGIVHYDNGKGFEGVAHTDDNGMYRVAVPSAETGEFTLYAQYDVYVGEPVSVTVASDKTVDLTVSGDSTGRDYVVTGVVTDESGNRLANAHVELCWGNDKSKTAMTSTDSTGKYVFSVPAGTYYVTAEYKAGNGLTYRTNDERAVHVVVADVTDANLAVMIHYGITVTVVDADGKAVPGAKVTWEGASAGYQYADGDGVVARDLPAGEYRFHASTESRVGEAVSVTVSGPAEVRLVLDKVGVKSDVPEVIGSGIRVYGYVYAPNGSPVGDVPVTLEAYDVDAGEFVKVTDKVTDAKGYYEFPGLDKAVYRVTCEYGYAFDATTADTGYAVKGGLTDANGNKLLGCTVELYDGSDLVATVDTGDTGSYAFPVDRAGDYRVVVRDAGGDTVSDGTVRAEATMDVLSDIIRDVAGRPVAGAAVTVLDKDGKTVVGTVTDSNGRYLVNVKPGEYRVSVVYPMDYQVDAYGYERDTTDRNAPYLRPTVFTIKGVVKDDDGKAVPGATVVLKDANNVEVDRRASGEDGGYEFTVEKDGIYYVEVVWGDANRKVYEVDTRYGDTGDVSGSVNIAVKVDNYTATHKVVEPAEGWRTGTNTFQVTGEEACVVLLVRGDAISELACDGLHRFTADLAAGDEIVVALVGDANLDGRVDTVDPTCVMRWLVKSFTSRKMEYSMYTMDVNRDGRVDTVDPTCIMRFLVKSYQFRWYET